MIREKVSREDLILYEILRHPVLASEFIQYVDFDPRYSTEFKLTQYQKEILCDFNDHVSVCTARAVGKTVSLVSLILWALVYNVFPGDYILYAVPSKVHLQPVWEGLLRSFKTNSFLSHFVQKKAGINSSDFSIRTLNGASLICRIAGQSGTGSNLVGLHTPFILVDEGGYFPWNAFNEMQPDLNTFTRGNREVVCGVPTGLRENNVLYHVDQENTMYTKHRVSAYDNPRITKEDIEWYKEQYRGEDSDDFTHYVLGRHGKPVYSLFDRSLFKIESYPVFKIDIDGIKLGDNMDSIFEKASLIPHIGDNQYGVLFGIDLGYTEPTAIYIMYIDGNDRLRFHAKLRLVKVSYPIQEKFIDTLDSRFSPFVIGMDRGNAGLSVIQTLQNSKDYVHKDYSKRLLPIDFSSSTVLGVTSDGNENKVKTKELSVSLLQEYSNNQKIVYSYSDMETVSELERMTYTKNPNGDIVYRTLTERGGRKGEDHFTSALLCGISAYYFTMEFGYKIEKKRLLKPMWV